MAVGDIGMGCAAPAEGKDIGGAWTDIAGADIAGGGIVIGGAPAVVIELDGEAPIENDGRDGVTGDAAPAGSTPDAMACSTSARVRVPLPSRSSFSNRSSACCTAELVAVTVAGADGYCVAGAAGCVCGGKYVGGATCCIDMGDVCVGPIGIGCAVTAGLGIDIGGGCTDIAGAAIAKDGIDAGGAPVAIRGEAPIEKDCGLTGDAAPVCSAPEAMACSTSARVRKPLPSRSMASKRSDACFAAAQFAA